MTILKTKRSYLWYLASSLWPIWDNTAWYTVSIFEEHFCLNTNILNTMVGGLSLGIRLERIKLSIVEFVYVNVDSFNFKQFYNI